MWSGMRKPGLSAQNTPVYILNIRDTLMIVIATWNLCMWYQVGKIVTIQWYNTHWILLGW